MAEQSFFDEGSIRVTSSRIVVRGTTYSTANVTSVTTFVQPPDRGRAGWLIAGGVLGAIGSLSFIADAPGPALLSLLVALTASALGVAWFRSLRPTFTVVLNTAAGEQKALQTADEDLVDRFRHAVEAAIVARD